MSSYKREDFINSTEVRWCPGCGDYAILNALQRVMPELGLPPEQHVFVSGIGCAGRLPYYMNTYGFHTIHGRALSVATGLRALRDDLAIWVITGDGDALSIGGNHFIHALRRNVNLNVLLFNNQVYGLTKGQFSPTSQLGQVTKTSPEGVNQAPINPLVMALAAGATFIARGIDKDPQHLATLLRAAHEHKGLSFIEIYQDCNIFNQGAFDEFALKANRQAHTVLLDAGKPLVYGQEGSQALTMQDGAFVTVPSNTPSLLQHDTSNWMHAMQLAKLQFPAAPVPIGIYYQSSRAVFSAPYQVSKTEDDLAKLYRMRSFKM
ncbi:MAG: 2-oxoacid:ferredoxin oxidoreductase subunit beta [Gammaproteobacteria bacterium]|nr:2-oxoacid:ferredoxin oxidoreductase subunit beta [Gammaproteobacteria bacterium]